MGNSGAFGEFYRGFASFMELKEAFQEVSKAFQGTQELPERFQRVFREVQEVSGRLKIPGEGQRDFESISGVDLGALQGIPGWISGALEGGLGGIFMEFHGTQEGPRNISKTIHGVSVMHVTTAILPPSSKVVHAGC